MDVGKLIKDEAGQDPLVGQLIRGKYRVISRLATGRTGTVYLAQQTSTGIRVAVKVVQDELARDERFVKRFRQLMLAVAALSEHHDNIVRVFECEQAEDGRLFVAMNYLDGRLLSDVLRQESPLEIERALFLAEQMAWGLSTVHTAGIVHTDVRPENFMVVGKIEAVKVLGFERASIGGVGAMDCLGSSGAISMAPEYLAPEQIKGKEITRQTDIYALGVVLYQMLTGVAPFRAATPEAVLAMHLQKAPIPLRKLRPEIPAVLEGKVLQALEKEPQERMIYAYDVVNKSLYERVMDELQAQPVQGEGLVSRMREALQAASGDTRSLTRKSRHAGAGTKLAATSGVQKVLQADFDARSTASESFHAVASWKLTASIGLLILVAALAWWMVFVRRPPEVPSASSPGQNAPPQQEPGAAQEPGPTVASGPEGTAGERVPLETSQEDTARETTNPIEKKSMAARKQEKPRPPRNARILAFPRSDAPVHAAPRSEAPATKAESPSATPDPTEVIDWLLQHR